MRRDDYFISALVSAFVGALLAKIFIFVIHTITKLF